MKRFLTSLAILLTIGTVATNAQTQSDYFTVRAGANFADLQNNEFYSDVQTGFNAALLYNISLAKSAPVYLQTGVEMQMKGAKNTGILGELTESHLKSYMVEVPLVATVDLPIGSQTAIVPMLGAYYSFAFAGTLENDDQKIHQFRKETYEFEDGTQIETRLMRQSDIGIRAGISFLYNKCLIGFAYDAGLMNVFAKEFREMGYKAVTGTWSINLAYRFR